MQALCCWTAGILSIMLLSKAAIAQPPSQELSPQNVIPPTPYKAKYTLVRRGTTLGKGVRELTRIDNDTWQLRYFTKASFLFLSDKREELSKFSIVGGQVKTQWYQFKRAGTGPDILNQIVFDHEARKLLNGSTGKEIEQSNYASDLFDQISYQMQIQLDLRNHDSTLQYPLVTRKGRSKEYRFEVVTEELITLPYGKLNTVKIKRVTGKKKRQTYAWLAPAYDYLLVRIQQFEEGKENYDAQLTHLDWPGDAAGRKWSDSNRLKTEL